MTAIATPALAPRRGQAGSRELVAIVVGLMMTTSFAIDLMLPAFPDMRRAFGMAADSTQVTATVTAYFYGLAIGPWLYGPASDRFGRRRPLYVGLSVCVVASALAALAPVWWMVVAARFLWGLGAGAPRTLAAAIIRDRYEGNTMARLMSLIMAVFMLAPIAAPMLGAGLIELFPWQSVFWFPVLLAGGTMLWLRRLPETLPPEKRRSLDPRSLRAAVMEVLRTPQTMWLTLAMTVITGVITAFIGASQVIIDDVFDRGDLFAPCFAGIAVLMGLNSLLTARRVQRHGAEHVLRRNVIGAVIATAAFLVVVEVSDGRPNFWIFLGVWAVAMAIVQSVNPTCFALAMAPLPHIAGTTSSVIATITAAGGATLGSIAANAFDGTPRPYVRFFLAYTVVVALMALWALRSATTDADLVTVTDIIAEA